MIYMLPCLLVVVVKNDEQMGVTLEKHYISLASLVGFASTPISHKKET